MSDSNNPAHEKGISVKCEEEPKNCHEKAKLDGGENKIGGTVGGGTPRINEEVKSTLLFAATSIAAGYISFLLTPAKPAFISITSLLLALGSMIAILLVTVKIVQKIAGKKNMQWIMGNGGAIYLFLWFVSWIIFYNVL